MSRMPLLGRLAGRARHLAGRLLFGRRVFLHRDLLAFNYLKGDGIEIGALEHPQAVPSVARVTYVDRLPVETLGRYEDLQGHALHRVDIIDDAERLDTFRDGSQDFVIGNHLLEHCENPIAALENMLRVLRPGGILFLAVPDKRYTFDADRPVTPLAHVIRDYEEGPAWSKRQHFEEWSRVVNKREEARVEEEVRHLMNINYSIHFHVWTQAELLGLVQFFRTRAAFDIEAFLKSKDEMVMVLRKDADARER